MTLKQLLNFLNGWQDRGGMPTSWNFALSNSTSGDLKYQIDQIRFLYDVWQVYKDSTGQYLSYASGGGFEWAEGTENAVPFTLRDARVIVGLSKLLD